MLGKFRDGELRVTAQAVSAMLKSLDTIKLILSVLEATEAEPPGDDSGLIARLNAIAEGREVPAAPSAPAEPAPAPGSQRRPRSPPLPEPEHVPAPASAVVAAPVVVAGPRRLRRRLRPWLRSRQPPPAGGARAARGRRQGTGRPRTAPGRRGPGPRAPAANAGFTADETRDAANKESAVAAQSIRVNVELLEKLMTLVSELVLTRNQLLQILRGRRTASSRRRCSGSAMSRPSCRKAS